MSKCDGQFLESLVNQNRKNVVRVEKVTGNIASSGENLKLAKHDHFQLYSKLYLIISTDQGLQSRLGTSIKMLVCLFALQILWTRESRETVKKIRAAIKAGLITLTRIIVMNVHSSKSVINQAQRQKLIASRLNLKHIKTREPFRQLKHFKTSSSYGIELTRRMQKSKSNIVINKLI